MAHCQACRADVDHVEQHDDLLVAGLVEYDGLNVILTSRYSTDLAHTIQALATI